MAQSENLSALYITSEDPSAQGRAFVDAGDANAAAQLLLADRDGNAVCDGVRTQLRACGRTDPAAAGKRSYQLRLDQACDLAACGEAAERWTLLACCDDATLLARQALPGACRVAGHAVHTRGRLGGSVL